MMQYLRVLWLHAFEDEPIDLLSELDDDRMEVRKVEIFRGGQRGRASAIHEDEGTMLGTEPVPSLQEINEDPQFRAREIDSAEFELEWSRAAVPSSECS
jgi:hypothetical protein